MEVRGFFYFCLPFDMRFFGIFIKFIGVGVVWPWGVCMAIKYYRIAESRWGIVFMVGGPSCSHKGRWGYGGVRRYAYMGCQGY